MQTNVPEFFAKHEVAEFREDLVARMALPAHQQWPYFVMHCSAQVIGCGGYFIAPDAVAGLVWGMIHRTLHRKGYGRRLLEYRLHHMHGKAQRLKIDTTPASFPFYRKMGFVEAHRVANGYAPGLDKVIAFLPI